jgi:hydroxymethylpyrimidine pyrophosphatase-like HAD family hydrolase
MLDDPDRTFDGHRMANAIQAIAVDYDGTLTEDDHPDEDVIAAIRESRARGQAVVLVTGRILSELRSVFPGVDAEFDAIVAENGAVLRDADGVRDLVAPVDALLGQALAHREIPIQQGRVLLACATIHAGAVLEEITRLGIDAQVVRNRGALMVLPGGVTKGTGLEQALGELGISRHSTIGVGDAENDHHLLQVCELGVAVGNAVDALKQRADLVLDEPDGAGVSDLLRGPVVRGSERLPPRSWQLTLGRDEIGNPVRMPASQVNLLLTGGSGAGKSYITGLVVEQLAELGYGVLVIDREGDHAPLTQRRGILGVGGAEPLPSPRHLAALLRHRFGSVVVDLSQTGLEDQQAYLHAVAPSILAQRAVTGLPHWIVFEEAHTLPNDVSPWADALSSDDTGFCFSTYRPTAIPESVRPTISHFVLAAGGRDEADESLEFVARAVGCCPEKLALALGDERGRAALVSTDDPEPSLFEVGARSSGHVRHWHKYIDGSLPTSLRFFFEPHERGRVAANLREFHRHLGASGAWSVEVHARSHDFSAWIRAVLQDEELAGVVQQIERRLRADEYSADAVRDAIQLAIERRYLE